MRCPKGTPTETMRLTSCSASSCLVQVRHQSEWGSICGQGVGQAAAKLICKEMGFPGVKRVEEAGRGSGRIWLSDLSCVGDEISATMCSHREWGNAGTCNHLNDLGVCCSGKRNTAQICLMDCCCSLHVLRDRFSRSNLADIHSHQCNSQITCQNKNTFVCQVFNLFTASLKLSPILRSRGEWSFCWFARAENCLFAGSLSHHMTWHNR